MVDRLISVGDDLTLPPSVKATDANLPERLGATQLSATIAEGIGTEGYDIIPLLGQSNHLRGNGIDRTYFDGPHARVWQFANLSSPYADKVIAAADPLHHQEMPGQTGGFALTFAKIYSEYIAPKRKVLLVPCARGNTGFASTGDYTWRVGQSGPTNLYALAIAQINKALAVPGDNRVAAVLWHQGEANNASSASSYANDLDNVITDLRTRYGATMPFVLGQMSPIKIAESAGYATIDGVHKDTPNRKPYVGMWEAVNRVNLNDVVHFSAEGQRINGRTCFDAYQLALTLEGGIAPAPDIAPPSTPGFTDTFEKPDATALGFTGEGKPWSVVDVNSNGSTWAIVGGTAKYNGGSARSIAYVEGNAADGTITLPIANIGAAVGGIAGRVQDANNYIGVLLRQVAGTNRLQLVKRVAGSSTLLGTSAADKVTANGSVVELVMTGTSLSVKLDGVVVIGPVTANEFATNTRHGLLGDAVDLTTTYASETFTAA